DMCGIGLRTKAFPPIPLEPRDTDIAPTDVLGLLSHPGDVLAEASPLPSLKPGDALAIPNAGAYGLCASYWSFNGHPAPAGVACDGTKIETTRTRQPARAVLEGQVRLKPKDPAGANGKPEERKPMKSATLKKPVVPQAPQAEDQPHFIGGQWRGSASGKTF